MGVGEAFIMAGHIYVLGAVIALGMAALIKLICFVIDRSDKKAAARLKAAGGEGGAAQ